MTVRPFLDLILRLLFPRTDEEVSSYITDGGNDRGADAIHIVDNGDSAQVSIIQSKYARNLKNSKKNFPGAEIDKLLSLITDIIDRNTSIQNSVNPILRSRIDDIWRLIDTGRTINIKVYLVSNTLPLIYHEKNRLSSYCRQYPFVSYEEINFDSIARLIESDERLSENGTLNSIDIQKFERIDCDIRGLIANVDAKSYVKMISTDDGNSIKRHIFDENIRGYLGVNGGYNRQILDSATSDENHLFWYLNNGITIVAKDFSHQNIRGSTIKLKDFQIVNGAQTSYSLFSAGQIEPEKLDQIVLLVKIFASSRDDISEKIAIATNSQARIAPRDLKANDSIQKRIASILDDGGILYERKKSQFSDDVSKPIIDSLKLGQAILSYSLKRPHQAKTQSDEIFGSLYNEVFSENIDANHILRLAKLYLHVSKDRDMQLGILRSATSSFSENEFIGYAQWHILYCIRLLSEEDNMEFPEEKKLDDYLRKANEIVSKIANAHKSQSYYRVFRSTKTAELIQTELGVGQLNFDF